MSSPQHGTELRGRRSECESLDRLLEDVRAGQSRVLVLRGGAARDFGERFVPGYAPPSTVHFLMNAPFKE